MAMGSGFPDNLAIVGDAFLKSCEWFASISRAMLTGTVIGYSIYDYSNGARVGFAASINNH